MVLGKEDEQVIDELVLQIVDFLPGPAPGCPVMADSFQGIARELAVQEHWSGPSKPGMLKRLLTGTFETAPEKLDELVTLICRRSLRLRSLRNPLTRGQVESICELCQRLGLLASELKHGEFVASLSGETLRNAAPTLGYSIPALGLLSRMREDLVALARLPLGELGYACEVFMNKFLIQSGLVPRVPLRLRGEQIVGTLDLGTETYLVECWWHTSPDTEEAERLLHLLSDQVMLSGVIVIGMKGLGADVQNRLKQGDTQKLVALDVRDIMYVLDGGTHLEKALALKLEAARQGNSFVPLHLLLGTQERTT